MTVAIALPKPMVEQLTEGAQLEVESAWFGSAGFWTRGSDVAVAAWELVPSASADYHARTANRLELVPRAWVPTCLAACRAGHAVLYAHSHPHGSSDFSQADDRVDTEIRDALDRMGGGELVPLVSVVVARDGDLSARVWLPGGAKPAACDVIRVCGDQLELKFRDDLRTTSPSFDRQVRSLGAEGQAMLSRLRVAVVGVGGTGSAVYEQLLRLGVTNITVIDPDELTSTSVTRGYGSGVDQVGLSKVEVARRLAASVGLKTNVVAIEGSVCERDTALELTHTDLVFACTDDHAGRLILNRLAYVCVVPVLDLGVAVTSRDGLLNSIDVRVTWVCPGTACLLCRDRISPEIAAAEQLDPRVRAERAAEGYAPELGQPDPSVVTYTASAAALAVSEALQRSLGLSETEATEILWSPLVHRLSTNNRAGRPGCFCQRDTPAVAGPFLGLTWSE